MTNRNSYFLPYQIEWLHDKSQFKIWEKSRRIGATYVQAFEDVVDCLEKKVPSVWFTSADISAAKEYINYCRKWADIFKRPAKDLGEIVVDSEKVLAIEFANGTRINAMSSAPSQMRSKGGKIVIDEFAFHKNPSEMWAAAFPATTWGYPMRILSTHNGKQCLYYDLVEKAKKKENDFSIHSTPIELAVEQGMADKIMRKELTAEERATFIDGLRKNCSSDIAFDQEYRCMAVDEATAFLTFDLINSCQIDNVERPLEDVVGDLYIGIDIARKNHLTVITIGEELPGTNIFACRKRIELTNTKFSDQEAIIYPLLRHPKFKRCAVDATGIGAQIAERLEHTFGASRIDKVWFTSATKEEMAYNLLQKFQDRQVLIPKDKDLTADLHSIQKFTTTGQHIRLDQSSTASQDTTGHADRFWSLGLMLYSAIRQKVVVPDVKSRRAKIPERKGWYKLKDILPKF